MKKMKPIHLILCALFAALTAALSQISIPIQPILINLATLSVLCAGLILGAKLGAISQTVYMLLGAIGLPVFSRMSGGIAVILGPTGGYIIGYIVAAWLIGFIADRSGNKYVILALAAIAGAFTYLSLGTLWYMFSSKTDFLKALSVCFIPFLIGDALKITVAVILSHRLRPILVRKVA